MEKSWNVMEFGFENCVRTLLIFENYFNQMVIDRSIVLLVNDVG